MAHDSAITRWSLSGHSIASRGAESRTRSALLLRLAEHKADVWSLQEDWLRTTDPAMRELLMAIFG